MGSLKSCLISTFLVTCASSLIIPDEITSLLSLVYSNIPPIKKGTDSRLGVGFRLGPYADFQVQLELGPQSNTQPVGPSTDSKRRRNSEHNVQDSIGDSSVRDSSVRDSSVGNSVPAANEALPANWLAKWRSALQGNAKVSRRSSTPSKQVSKETVSQMKSETNPEVVTHLRQLFGNNTSNSQ